MWKYFVTTYFDFSKKERIGVSVLCGLIILVMGLPYLFPFFIKPAVIDYKDFETEIASLEIAEADSVTAPYPKLYQRKNYSDYNKSTASTEPPVLDGELFYFDPNTAAEAEWSRLGLRDKTIATILRFRSKGGKFYKPEDIGKIWGLHPELSRRLVPFVQIERADPPRYPASPARTFDKPLVRMVDLNLADSSDLVALPGIGPKLSQRIILFRDKLGGFYSVDQVKETFGLPDSTFQKIRPKLELGSQAVKKLNVNTATLEELKAHPYLRYAIANALVQYRTQHGNFATIEDLEKIMILSPEQLLKATPYLRVN